MDDRRDMQGNRPQQNINLQPKDILEKDFKQKMRGYDQAEVDEFLDDVIKDYETFNSQLQQLSQENSRLISRVDELTKQASAEGPNTNGGNVGGSNLSTYDVLKRLANLERRVFGQSQGQTQPNPATQGTPTGATANRNQNNFVGGVNNAGAQANNSTISSRAGAGHYQNTTSAAAPQARNNNNYQVPTNNPMNRPNNPQAMPQSNMNPNGNSNGMHPNNIPNSNITDARPNNNRNYQNYNNNRFDQNDPDPRYQNNNTNRYNNGNNDLNRF